MQSTIRDESSRVLRAQISAINNALADKVWQQNYRIRCKNPTTLTFGHGRLKPRSIESFYSKPDQKPFPKRNLSGGSGGYRTLFKETWNHLIRPVNINNFEGEKNEMKSCSVDSALGQKCMQSRNRRVKDPP